MDKIKVLYLAGAARSGSTLLGRLLGQPEEGVHVGELVFLWQRSFRERHVCGCGAPFLECPFWTDVFHRGFGGFESVDYEEILETKRQLERVRALTNWAAPQKAPVRQQRLDEYQSVLGTLYQAIAETSGARIIIDGSKSEAYGSLLKTVPGLEVRVMHLVRDSRAVAHSHQRRKPDPTQVQRGGTMLTVSPARMALLWNAVNLLLSVKMPDPPTFLRYEDFVADPLATIQRLWALMEEPVPVLDFLRQPVMRLRTNHTVAGNPDRFHAEVNIRPDVEWRQKMSRHDRLLVTALTFPLLSRYGYLQPPPTPEQEPRRLPAGVL